MTKLAWDSLGDRLYEIGVDRGVFYPKTGNGVPWNGLVSVTESSTENEPIAYYIDGYKYHNRGGPEEYQASLEAFTYPPEFAACDGIASLGRGLFATHQPRATFGLSYRTLIGNDLVASARGYKIHLVYNALATASDKAYTTSNDSPDPMKMSWNLTVKPVKQTGHKPIQHLIIDSTLVDAPLLASLEAILYGTAISESRLPTPNEIITLFTGFPSLFVAINSNGTFTISGPDDVLQIFDARTFQIIAGTVVINGDGTFDVSSY